MKAGEIESKELTIYYDMQCPYVYQRIDMIKQYCEEHDIPVSFIHVDTQQKAKELQSSVSDSKVIYAYEMDIRPCAGCNFCWLKTPGTCTIKDGYEEILEGYLTYDATIFLTGTALNFVDHRMKNVIDRLLPLATMYIRIVDGQCRHEPRYEKK